MSEFDDIIQASYTPAEITAAVECVVTDYVREASTVDGHCNQWLALTARQHAAELTGGES